MAFEKRGQYRVIKSLNSTSTTTNGDSSPLRSVGRNRRVGEEDIDAGDLASQNDAMNSCGCLPAPVIGRLARHASPLHVAARDRDNDWTVHCITILDPPPEGGTRKKKTNPTSFKKLP